MTGPRDHSHPGAHGVDVDNDRAMAGTPEMSALQVLMNRAVMTHPRMSGMPAAVDQGTTLDEIANRDARQRQVRLAQLGLEGVTDHEAIMARLAQELGQPLDVVRGYVEDDVRQYLEYHDLAKFAWRSNLNEVEFDLHMVGMAGTIYHDLVAVANALSLSMAEALVLVRSLIATDTPRTEGRTRKPEKS